MANTVSISANVSGNRYITVVGQFHNNHGSWNSSVPASTSVDGIGSNNHTLNIQKDSPTWQDTYDVGISYDNRTYTCRVYCYQWGSFSGNTDASTTVTVPAVARPVSVPGAPSNVTATFAPGSISRTDRIYIHWKTNPPTNGGISNNVIMFQTNDGEWADCGQVSGDTTSFELDTSQYPTNGKYKFKVASKNSAGISSYTESTAIYTTPTKPDLVFGFWRQKQAPDDDLTDGSTVDPSTLADVLNVTCSSSSTPYYIGKVNWKLGVAVRSKNATGNSIKMSDFTSKTSSSISLEPHEISTIPVSLVKDADQPVAFYAQCSVTTPDGQQTSEMTGMIKLSVIPRICIRSDVAIKNIFINSEDAVRGVYFRTS